MTMLSISDLHAEIDDTQILKGLNLSANPGETHAIMGPNGAGKSTLSKVLSGDENYEVTNGKVMMQNEELLGMDITERALNGLFIAYQNPVEIPGVSLVQLLKTALNAKLSHTGNDKLDTSEFLKLLKSKVKELGLPEGFYKNNVNANLSGGQKKLSELLQMSVLEPKLAILDEIDSGLDVDSLRLVAENINQLKSPERTIIMISHYQRILDYVKPNFVHILVDGAIVKTGGFELIEQIEKHGYAEWK